MVRTWVVGVVLAMMVAAPALAEPQSWQYAGPGQWQPVAAPTTQSAPAPELDRVQDLLDQEHWTAARKLAIDWLLQNPSHSQRDRALYLTAEALFGQGDRIKSYYYLDELLDTYPESPYYYPALEKQFQIADAYLRGYKRRFLGMRILSAREEAIEMLFRIQNRSPGSPLAEKALLRTADFYYTQGDYDFAEDAYGAYLRTYPRSPEVPAVRLRRAFSSLAQFRGVKFDPTPMIDAREQLRSIMVSYPQLAERENLASVVQRIDMTFARKLYETADFYRRTSEPGAAVYTYRYLINAYPNSEQAQLARERLDDMPPAALEQAPPKTVGPEGTPTPEEPAEDDSIRFNP